MPPHLLERPSYALCVRGAVCRDPKRYRVRRMVPAHLLLCVSKPSAGPGLRCPSSDASLTIPIKEQYVRTFWQKCGPSYRSQLPPRIRRHPRPSPSLRRTSLSTRMYACRDSSFPTRGLGAEFWKQTVCSNKDKRMIAQSCSMHLPEFYVWISCAFPMPWNF